MQGPQGRLGRVVEGDGGGAVLGSARPSAAPAIATLPSGRPTVSVSLSVRDQAQGCQFLENKDQACRKPTQVTLRKIPCQDAPLDANAYGLMSVRLAAEP